MPPITLSSNKLPAISGRLCFGLLAGFGLLTIFGLNYLFLSEGIYYQTFGERLAADRIFVIENKQVIASGGHDELLVASRLYREAFEEISLPIEHR